MTPPALQNIGYKLYIVRTLFINSRFQLMVLPLLSQIFAIINASFLPFIYLFYPETKGLSRSKRRPRIPKDWTGHPADLDGGWISGE
jgi:hypothetical protein